MKVTSPELAIGRGCKCMRVTNCVHEVYAKC